MHGLINKSIQCFVRDTYGAACWSAVARQADLASETFESLFDYEPGVTDRVIESIVVVLQRPRETVLEDLGTYLVSDPAVASLRRLLRFGGVNFTDFLHSLEDLQGRARLAVPELTLPELRVRDHTPDYFTLTCRSPIAGAGFVFLGLLRVMADDYGALVVLEHQGTRDGAEVIAISIPDLSYHEGNRFELGTSTG